MCLDIDYRYNNQNSVISTDSIENYNQNFNDTVTMESESIYKIKNVCGGSLIQHKPLFDPKGENMYVVRNDKIRIYNVETGEIVTELTENTAGKFIGLHLENSEVNECLITCTASGQVAFWKLKSYVVTQKTTLNFEFSTINKFLVTTIDSKLYALIHYDDSKNLTKLVVYDLTANKIYRHLELPMITNKSDVKVKMADGNGILAVITKQTLYVINKENFNYSVHSSPFPFNAVVCHPEQQIVATGDVFGKIFLWNQVFSAKPVKTELHWHHMIVLSLAFSQTGTVLYSGGVECVLVKWHIKEKTLDKNFLPRVSGGIQQISVDTLRDRIAICIDDNSIQIINSTLVQLRTLQDFTQVSPYDIGLNKLFPAGIKVNPKNRHLVMNGRIGHLQFFSTKSMRLLFNLDITMKNVIPRQKKCNIFSTDVTEFAFSSCGEWMVTYECWNDRISSLDSRLKFWKFVSNKQTFSLHTQVENPHDKKIVAIEFANIENSIICATAGRDRVIKIWSLEASEEIQNPKMIWMLVDQVSYKNLSVHCLNFSHDASLLAAGFGNSLCVWDTSNFKLKCALSAPSLLDGSTNRVIIGLPSQKKSKGKKLQNGNATNFVEKRQKMLQLMNTIINDPTQALVNDITLDKQRVFKRRSTDNENRQTLKISEKKLIFQKLMETTDLKFHDKLQVLHKLNIYYNISSRMEQEFIEYVSRSINEDRVLYKGLQQGVYDIKNDSKYKILWRFKMWRARDVKRNRKIITVRKLLTKPIREEALKMKEEEAVHSLLPIKNVCSITNTIFCTDELAHLVIVSTSTRILIWNLLTLKIQGSFKIQSSSVTHDPVTNLIAVFTQHNELFVIHPSPAMTIFHQRNMPSIYSAVWVPQDNSKLQSLRVNWQAHSQLLFLTHDQEICTLTSPNSELDLIDLTSFMSETNEMTPSTPFAALFSKKDALTKSNEFTIRHILSNESGTVKEIINLSNHAMPPMSKLSKDLVSSLLVSQRRAKPTVGRAPDVIEEMVISDDEGEGDGNSESANMQAPRRRDIIEKSEMKVRELISRDDNIESEFKELKLEEFENFYVTKKSK